MGGVSLQVHTTKSIKNHSQSEELMGGVSLQVHTTKSIKNHSQSEERVCRLSASTLKEMDKCIIKLVNY